MREITEAIEQAISKLPQESQAIFRLSRYDQRTNKEICIIMHVSERIIEYHITQSLKSLRLYLKDFVVLD
jgi:RNA polymerase sigma factor (sigma-70 family)